MKLAGFVKPLVEFHSQSLSSKIEVFGWYLHEIEKQERFSGGDLNACFDAMHLPRPKNVSSLLTGLATRPSKRLLRDSKGYRLSAAARSDWEKWLPVRRSAAEITALLQGLEARVTNVPQRTFLGETLKCFEHGAYRASIVMAWNLAYSHVCDVLFDKHLAALNAQLTVIRNRKKPIGVRTDFEDVKESDVLEAARGASLISGATYKTLLEKLNKRNTAAHPSSSIVTTATAEEVIADLVENVLLRTPL